eukprot:1007588-Rhodomonas_salina.1
MTHQLFLDLLDLRKKLLSSLRFRPSSLLHSSGLQFGAQGNHAGTNQQHLPQKGRTGENETNEMRVRLLLTCAFKPDTAIEQHSRKRHPTALRRITIGGFRSANLKNMHRAEICPPLKRQPRQQCRRGTTRQWGPTFGIVCLRRKGKWCVALRRKRTPTFVGLSDPRWTLDRNVGLQGQVQVKFCSPNRQSPSGCRLPADEGESFVWRSITYSRQRIADGQIDCRKKYFNQPGEGSALGSV